MSEETAIAEPQTPGQTDPSAAAWSAIRASFEIVSEAMEHALADAGLPPLAWYDVLVTVDARPAPVRPKDMLCQVSVTKSGLTRLLDRIEKAGLIERTYCPSDRRGTFIAITDAGKDTLAEMRPVREAAFRRFLGDRLAAEDAEVITAALDSVAASAAAELEGEGNCEVD